MAKASLKELLEDYEDYLRVRNLRQWKKGEAAFERAREVCATHNNTEFFKPYFEKWSDVQAANVAIIMINQNDFLLFKLIERLKADFLEKGGIREQMAAARRKKRGF